jgi:hypothetical protein
MVRILHESKGTSGTSSLKFTTCDSGLKENHPIATMIRIRIEETKVKVLERQSSRNAL